MEEALLTYQTLGHRETTNQQLQIHSVFIKINYKCILKIENESNIEFYLTLKNDPKDQMTLKTEKKF